jgi:hypothetical protein
MSCAVQRRRLADVGIGLTPQTGAKNSTQSLKDLGISAALFSLTASLGK